MCLVLYIGLDGRPPLIAPQDFSGIDAEDASWPSQVVPFSVQEPTSDTHVVASKFDTKFVYYAGSFEGCGCGFNACHVNEWEDPVELSVRALAGRESRKSLREYVENHDVRQIYACWSGDEAHPPTSHAEIEPAKLEDWTFEIPERGMLRIVPK